MQWTFEKFKGNLSIYAICPKCGFYHSPSTIDANMETTITHQYRYCPMCGEYLYVQGENIEVIWNQRDIVDLWEG